MGEFFGTDGIRGKANRHPMDAAMAFKVGQAVTLTLRKPGHRVRIIIGKDTRISGYMIESSLEAGICSMGVDAVQLGVLPTPGIAFLTAGMRAQAGVVISASKVPVVCSSRSLRENEMRLVWMTVKVASPTAT